MRRIDELSTHKTYQVSAVRRSRGFSRYTRYGGPSPMSSEPRPPLIHAHAKSLPVAPVQNFRRRSPESAGLLTRSLGPGGQV